MNTIAELPNYWANFMKAENSLVYRAESKRDNRPVILKVLRQDYPTPSELTRYKQEYEITSSLNVEGAIAAYDLVPYENTIAIVLEDFGAKSLELLLQSWKITIPEFLQFAIQVFCKHWLKFMQQISFIKTSIPPILS